MPDAPFLSQSILFLSHHQRDDITKYLSTHSITIENNPDVLMLESEKALGIDDVRDLQTWSMDKPYAHDWKIAVLLRAETLTLAAQNAMLKLLEEPPEHTYIVLMSAGEQQLVPTVRSRLQVMHSDDGGDAAETVQFPTTTADAFAKIDEIAKSRDQTLEFCTALLRQTQHQLEAMPSAKLLAVAGQLCDTIDLLKHNVNTRLALEQLLIR